MGVGEKIERSGGHVGNMQEFHMQDGGQHVVPSLHSCVLHCLSFFRQPTCPQSLDTLSFCPRAHLSRAPTLSIIFTIILISSFTLPILIFNSSPKRLVDFKFLLSLRLVESNYYKLKKYETIHEKFHS